MPSIPFQFTFDVLAASAGHWPLTLMRKRDSKEIDVGLSEVYKAIYSEINVKKTKNKRIVKNEIINVLLNTKFIFFFLRNWFIMLSVVPIMYIETRVEWIYNIVSTLAYTQIGSLI